MRAAVASVTILVICFLTQDFLIGKSALGQEGHQNRSSFSRNYQSHTIGGDSFGDSFNQEDEFNQLPYKYIGNSFSGKFHRPSCKFAKVMSVKHVCLFHFRRQAIDDGQIPCRYCLPPTWKTVKARLLPGSRSQQQVAPQPGIDHSNSDPEPPPEPLGTTNNL